MLISQKYIFTNLTIFTAVIIVGFILSIIAYSHIIENVSMIRYANNIDKNPSSLHTEIEDLKNKKDNHQNLLNRIKKLKCPTLDSFADLAKDYRIKLTGVNLKGPLIAESDNSKHYTLVYTGGITGILLALNYIENNILTHINGITIHPNASDGKKIDMTITITCPECNHEH